MLLHPSFEIAVLCTLTNEYHYHNFTFLRPIAEMKQDHHFLRTWNLLWEAISCTHLTWVRQSGATHCFLLPTLTCKTNTGRWGRSWLLTTCRDSAVLLSKKMQMQSQISEIDDWRQDTPHTYLMYWHIRLLPEGPWFQRARMPCYSNLIMHSQSYPNWAL